jgi:hypothetical protein
VTSPACNETDVLTWKERRTEGTQGGEFKEGNISLLKHSAGHHHITGSYGRRLENHFLLSLASTEPYKLYGYG